MQNFSLHELLIILLICSAYCLQSTVEHQLFDNYSSTSHERSKYWLKLNSDNQNEIGFTKHLKRPNLFRFNQSNSQHRDRTQQQNPYSKKNYFYDQSVPIKLFNNGNDKTYEYTNNQKINRNLQLKKRNHLLKQINTKDKNEILLNDNSDKKNDRKYNTNQIRRLQQRNENMQKEYIKNNRFNGTTCNWMHCDWNKNSFKSNFIQFWQPYPQIEIGFASWYNNQLERRYVLQLTTIKATCVRQLVSNISSGLYELKYLYAPHMIMSLANSQIFVYFNESKIDQKKAKNKLWHTATVSKIRIQNNNTSIYIKFCGNQKLTIIGVLLGEVSLKRTGNLPIEAVTDTQVENQDNNLQINQNNANQTLHSDQSNMNDTNDQKYQHQQGANLTYNTTQELMNASEYTQYLLQYGAKFLSNPIAANILTSSAIRKIFTKGFSFFINIDYLWLYIFHRRPFFTQINGILIFINDVESSKWNILPTDILNTYINIPQIQSFFDHKLLYTPEQILSVQFRSRQFIPMTLKFFILNIPLVIIIFFTGKLLNRLFNKLKFPQIFKAFTMNSFFIIILLEGNSESFTYFLISDLLTMFSFNIKMKIICILSIIVFFILILLLIAMPFIVRYLYQNKKVVQIYDKCKNSLRGSVFFMVEFGLFKITLGSIHILCEKEYKMQLVLLFTTEFLFILYTISNLYGRNVLNQKLIIWTMLWASLLRMLLILTFFLCISSPDIFVQQLDKVQQNCIILYFMLLIVGLIDFSATLLLKTSIKIYNKVRIALRKSKKANKKKKKIEVKDYKTAIKIQIIKNQNTERKDQMRIRQNVLQQKRKQNNHQKTIIKKEEFKMKSLYRRHNKFAQDIKQRQQTNIFIFCLNLK